MIRAILIDDETKSTQVLTMLVSQYCPQVEIVGTAKKPQQGIELIQALQPDLVFLDIEMPYMNGFSLLEAIFPITFEVIFVTAFENYALKAFRYNALDYLVKPISIEELRNAVDKAIQRVFIKKNNLLKNTLKIGKICLPIQEGIWFANVEDIVRCEADGKYTWFYFQLQDRRLVCRNLKEYEELLPEDTFFRVHHAHLVNLKYVQKYIKGRSGLIEMQDGSQVELSARKRDLFLTRFQEYMT